MTEGVSFSSSNKFDVQLSAARVHENALARLFSDASLKLELKTESWIWRKSGRIAIEYRCRGKPSGIAVTEADVWVHEVCSDTGEVITSLLFKVEMLKRICRAAIKRNQVCINCGDDNQSDVVLISIADLMRAAI